MIADALIAEISQVQDPQADIMLLRQGLAIESVTGNETPFARFLKCEMIKLDLKVEHSEFLPGRENVWGIGEGAADGSNLMIIGHSDTVHTRGWHEHWQNDPRSDPFGGYEIDGEIWGRGASDLKGGICAALAGWRLLQRAGYTLSGGIIFAFVGDEESGEEGTGVSAGIKALAERVQSGQLTKPDFAIYVEPTNLDIYTAQIGFFIAEIIVSGKTSYFGTPELGVDALKAAHEILTRIWEYEATLAAGPSHNLVGKSSLLVTNIAGGGFIAVPGQCKLSLIGKLRPGEQLDVAVAGFERSVASAALADGISVSISYPAGRDHPKGGSPVEIAQDSAPAKLLQEAIKCVRPQAGAIAGAPYWSEMPFLVNDIGCPAIYCAPGNIAHAHTFEERIDIDEYLAAVRAFALFIASYCGIAVKSENLKP